MSPSKLPTASNFSDRKHLWILLGTLFAIFLLFFGLRQWGTALLTEKSKKPFLHITFREFENFLWQNPHLINQRLEPFVSAYRPWTTTDTPSASEDIIVAPANLLYQFHTWKRLLGNSVAKRPMYGDEFAVFLEDNCQWQPANWPDAPIGYLETYSRLSKLKNTDLQTLSLEEFPLEVRLAFQGWKNYFREWAAIKNVNPTYFELNQFLKEHPEYNRYYWRNLVAQETPHYLESYPFGAKTVVERPRSLVPEQELSNFLKIGIYNYSAMTKPSG